MAPLACMVLRSPTSRLLRLRSTHELAIFPSPSSRTAVIHDCDGGWLAGQHVRLRVFFNGRLFEAHPLSIVTALPSTSCISGRTLILAARVCGDWTHALNAYAQEEEDRLSFGKKMHVGAPVQVMFDGAYGGCSIDLGDFESVLLVAVIFSLSVAQFMTIILCG